MDAQELRNLQEAYNQVHQVDESSIFDRAKNAVADQRLSDAQSSTQRSVDRLRNMPTVTRATAALAAREVERDVRTSSNYGPQLPKPGTVLGQRIEKPKPTGSKPKGSRLGGSSSLSGVGGSGATGGYQVGGSRGYGISGIRLADHYDVYDIILSHLLDEGYAETPEAAEAIMVNMSEEWRESIVDEMLDEANRGDEYATRNMSPDAARKYKETRRNTQFVNNKPKVMRNYYGGRSSGDLTAMRQEQRPKKKPLARSAGYDPETRTRDPNKIPMGKYENMLDKKRNPQRSGGYYG